MMGVMPPTAFSAEKRIFLLSKLDEVIKLWERGYGQGSFYFTVDDGVPSLHTGLQVGLEDDPVPDLQQPLPQPCHQGSQGPHSQTRKKRVRGPAQMAKNRERAAAYQARIRAATATAVTVASVRSTENPSVVKLPFSGNILHLKKNTDTGKKVPILSSGRTSPTPSSPPSSYAAVAAAPPPVKKVGTELGFVYNSSSAKKKLFSVEPSSTSQSLPAHNPIPAPGPSEELVCRRNFKKKEDDLFCKIFS